MKGFKREKIIKRSMKIVLPGGKWSNPKVSSWLSPSGQNGHSKVASGCHQKQKRTDAGDGCCCCCSPWQEQQLQQKEQLK